MGKPFYFALTIDRVALPPDALRGSNVWFTLRFSWITIPDLLSRCKNKIDNPTKTEPQ